MKLNLEKITLIGIDCNHLDKLILAADICDSYCSFGSIKLLSSIPSKDSRVIPIHQINSVKQYSKFIIKNLADYVDTKFALVFQYDGFILNPNAWTNDFFKYDYIGAPWYHLGGLRVGNGGFSLRSKRLLDFVSEEYTSIGGNLHPEDVWLSKKARPVCEANGIKFAPEEIASKFSKEGNNTGNKWNGEFGWHGAGYTDISRWLMNNPQYRESFVHKLDDFTKLMNKHPVYDESFHVFRFRRPNIKEYTRVSTEDKKYEARQDEPEHSKIKAGDTIIFKRSGIAYKKLPVPAHEHVVKRIERFKNLDDLKRAHPSVRVTRPSPSPHELIYDINPIIIKWISIFGARHKRNAPHSIYWFE